MTKFGLDNVKKNFGFGCMRLPMNGDDVDTVEFTKMVDTFMENGFNYFDTAHVYIGGKSELALRECLTSRYPRESYVFVNKLSGSCFNSQEEIRPFFQSQLEACGLDYFDIYLMHSQHKNNYGKYKECRAYETAMELKREGKIKHLGLSFHDSAEFLEQILTEHPEVEVVQIQFNYADMDDPSVESRKCYEVCRKFGKPIIVMEPVKGGGLVNLPTEAADILASLGGGSQASYAIRFAASFEGIIMVLSGMGSMEMMNDNISYMKDFKPLTEEEFAAIEKVREVFAKIDTIPCTDCKYCLENCPQNIPIPKLFACLNNKRTWDTWASSFYYNIYTKEAGKPTDCIKCGLCEEACPQHLKIRDLLCEVAEVFEKE
jgi:predicted aldo/keto reductase-like oxidoreductase